MIQGNRPYYMQCYREGHFPDLFHFPAAGLVSVSQSFSEAAELGPVQAPANRTDKVNGPQCRLVKVSHQDLPFLQQRLLVPKVWCHNYS